MKSDDIKYVLKWTNQIDDKFIEDFLEVENSVFGGFSRELFDHKYLANIYGPSLIAIAYLNDNPIAADSMIRNDVDGISFQSGDTCVLDVCRGMGIFTKMKMKEIEMLGRDVMIYGFPNANSYPGFVKMGWTVLCKYYPSIFMLPSLYDCENPKKIDVEYAKWLKRSSKKFYYVKFWKKYYLVMQGNRHYQMVGGIEPEVALLFEKKKHLGIIRCQTKKKRFYHKEKYHGSLICYGMTSNDIPYWKIDTLLN